MTQERHKLYKKREPVSWLDRLTCLFPVRLDHRVSCGRDFAQQLQTKRADSRIRRAEKKPRDDDEAVDTFSDSFACEANTNNKTPPMMTNTAAAITMPLWAHNTKLRCITKQRDTTRVLVEDCQPSAEWARIAVAIL